MNFFKSSFLKRVISAALLIPPIVFILLYEGSQLPVIILLIVAALWSSYEWQGMARRSPRKFLYLNLGNLYIALSFISFYLIYDKAGGEKALLLFAMVWVSDIGAYFFGKLIGGPKMIPKVSPNKTWAGLAGAVLAPAILWSGFTFLSGDHTYFLSFIFGLLIGLAGQGGDLLISFVKRQADLKDTGSLIPGHGGLLDRIDSMMLATPVFLVLFTLYLSLNTLL